MSQALNNAERLVRLVASHARSEDFEEALIQSAKALKELVADKKRLDRVVTPTTPRAGPSVYPLATGPATARSCSGCPEATGFSREARAFNHSPGPEAR